MAATRLPGKPLIQLAGKPLVRWVYEATVRSGAFDRVVVATPDPEIIDAAASFGAEVEPTSADHSTGTDRVAEVASRLPDFELVANVQGDQPLVDSAMLASLMSAFDDPEVEMSTLGAVLRAGVPDDPSVVKVVCDRRGDALYFSRAAIPYERTKPYAAVPVYHHLGLYAFRRGFLLQYASFEPTPLEVCEGLEQLRALEHGHAIRVRPVDAAVPEVNTPEDVAEVEARLRAP